MLQQQKHVSVYLSISPQKLDKPLTLIEIICPNFNPKVLGGTG